jgi:hypothetical protein
MMAAGAGLVTAGIGMSSIVNAVESNRSLANRGALLQNSSGLGYDFVSQSRAVSNATGLEAGDVMGGLEKLAAKSGGAGLNEVLPKFEQLAKVARGAGVTMTDLGDVMATIYNRGVAVDDLIPTFEALVQQGKDGAVEIKDLATQLDASSGALTAFQMNGKERVMLAGGLTQIARTWGRSSAEAATFSVTDLGQELQGKADLIQELTGAKKTGTKTLGGKKVDVLEGGVEIGTDSSRRKIRDIREILPEIFEKADQAGNLGKLIGAGGIFGGADAPLALAFKSVFTDGIKRDKTGRFQPVQEGETAEVKGAEAIRELLKQAAAADVKPGSSDKAFENVMKSDKLGVAMNKFQNDLGDKLAPRMGELANATSKVADKFLKVVDYTSGKSWESLAAQFLALNTAAGAAQGGLSALGGNFADIMSKQWQTGMAGLNLGTAGIAVTGATIVATGAYVTLAMAESSTKEAERGRAGTAKGLIARLNSGEATDADREEAQRLLGIAKEGSEGGVFGRIKSSLSATIQRTEEQASGGDFAGIMDALGTGLLGMLTPVVAAFDSSKNAENDILATALTEALKNSSTESGKALTSALQGATLEVRVTNASEINGRNPTTQPVNGE